MKSTDRLGDIQAAFELPFAAFLYLLYPLGFGFLIGKKGVRIVTTQQGWRAKERDGHT